MYCIFKLLHTGTVPLCVPSVPKVHVLDIWSRTCSEMLAWCCKKREKPTKTYKVRWRSIASSAIPLVKILDAFVKCFCEPLIMQMCGHHFPTLDKEFEARDDAPDSGRALAWKRLLDVWWLLHNMSQEGNKSKRTYHERIPDVPEALPIFASQKIVGVAPLLCQIWHVLTCICKENELINCLWWSEISVWTNI